MPALDLFRWKISDIICPIRAQASRGGGARQRWYYGDGGHIAQMIMEGLASISISLDVPISQLTNDQLD
jgi:hypothetical protein